MPSSSARPSVAPGREVPRAALVAGALVAGLALAAVILPEPPHPPTLCLFKMVTGRPCPACGFLRAARLLVRGDVFGALVVNPLDTVAMLLAPPAALAWFLGRTRGTRVAAEMPRRVRMALWWLLGAAVGSNWIYVLAVRR